MFSAEGVNPQEINLSKTEENFSLVKGENLCHGEEEQREDVQQPIDDTDITEEIVIPPGGKTFVVIICTAM